MGVPLPKPNNIVDINKEINSDFLQLKHCNHLNNSRVFDIN